MTSMNKLLHKHKVEKGAPYNFTLFSKPYGCFYFHPDDLDDLYTTIANNHLKSRPHVALTEKQGQYSPLLIDIDLKYPSTADTIKHFSVTTVETLVRASFECLNRFIDTKQVFCYVHERPQPYFNEKSVLKDGFHLLFPAVRCPKTLKDLVRNHIIETCADELLSLKTSNSIEDIVDKAVLGTNNWFVYGGGKPEASPYLLTRMFDSRIIERCTEQYTFLALVKLFSVQGEIESVKWLPYALETIQAKNRGSRIKQANSVRDASKRVQSSAGVAQESAEPAPQSAEIAQGSSENHDSSPTIEVTSDLLSKVVMGLSAWRAEAEPDWIEIVWAILKTSRDNNYKKLGRDLIHSFSQKSLDKYDENSVEDKINSIKPRDDGKTFRSLVHCLQTDNPDLHSNLFGPNKEYLSVKTRFEKDHFKTLEPTGWFRETNQGLLPKRKKELMDDYENLYYQESNGENIVKKPFLKRWFGDESIRTYRKVDFLPRPNTCPEDVYNLFSGFRAELLPDTPDSVDLSLVWDLLSKLCGNEHAVIEYTVNWLSHLIQKPGELSRTGLLWKSNEGCGKNLFLNWFGEKILGPHYYFTTTNITDLFGDFAVGLKHKLLVNMNEAASIDTHMFVERIKSAITDETINYQAKHVNTIVLRNFARFVFTTNNSRAIKCGVSDRRWVAIECDSSRCNDNSYFAPLKATINDNSAKAFYQLLSVRDISSWDPTNRPCTALYKELKITSIPVLSKWLLTLIELDEEVFNEPASSMLAQFKSWCITNGFDKVSSKVNATNFGIDLKKYTGVESNRDRYGTVYSIDNLTLHADLVRLGHVDKIV